MRYEPLVLTLDETDPLAQELAKFAQAHESFVDVSTVRGFGRPELRIGANRYIRGAHEIIAEIERKERESLLPPVPSHDARR